MNSTEINKNRENPARNKEAFYGSLGSVLFHLIVLAFVIFLLKGSEGYGSGSGGYYVDITAVKGEPAPAKGAEDINSQKLQDRKGLPEEKPEITENKPLVKPPSESRSISSTREISKSVAKPSTGNYSGYGNMETAGFDSSSLGQFYKEPTLNVRLRYPSGWVYMDQQRKKKLDGITFWASGSNFNPPPYIHVEVVDKYIFNPDQYKFRYDFEKFIGYYNDPVELENQVSQVIYLRTDDDEDYTIKLIMDNKDAFKQFQPVFFAIVKSFKFGSSFL